MSTVHELKQLKAQLAEHSRSLHAMAVSTRRLQKALAAVITSTQSKPTTPAPRPNRSGVSATSRRGDEQDRSTRSSNALERRGGNLF
jgi:hypothetical protein